MAPYSFFIFLLKCMRWTFVQILQTNVTLTSALLTMDFRLKKWKFWKQKFCEAQATEIEILK